MLSLSNIKHLHMEFSTICNARCPLCPRNLFGYPINHGYKETNLSLELVKKSFHPIFVKQLTNLQVNGNFGDFVSNPESLTIVKSLQILIFVSTIPAQINRINISCKTSLFQKFTMALFNSKD